MDRQTTLPGWNEAVTANVAKLRAAASLKAKVPQKPADHGLFSDERDQIDLVDLTRAVAR